MAEGWVKLDREILDSAVFANPRLLKLWVWCKCSAAWKEQWLPMRTGKGETEVKLSPGQFVFGRKAAAKKLKIPATTVERLMKKLETLGMIRLKPGTHFSVVTVCNSELYKSAPEKSGQPTGRQRAGNGQATGTKRMRENAKKDQKAKKRTRRDNHAHALGRKRKSGTFANSSTGLPNWSLSRARTGIGWRRFASWSQAAKKPASWLESGLEAIRRKEGTFNKSKSGFLWTVLEDEAKQRGKSIKALLRSVEIPDAFRDAYRRHKETHESTNAH